MKTGIAWYRKEQWGRLRSVSSDGAALERTFEEWATSAERRLAELKAAGNQLEKIDVDVEELISWCKTNGLPIDGRARAKFAAQKLREKDAC